ncbi:MAG: hypothetical protein V1721_02270 [Pseudomonadota bacterium]
MDLMRRILTGTAMVLAVAMLVFSSPPAKAQVVDTPFGACVGIDGGDDCVTTTGHISASVVGTLSINEMRAVSFGNMAVTCAAGGCDGSASFDLNLDSTRDNVVGVADNFILLNGAQANDGIGNLPGHANSGSQQAGHYTVTGMEAGPTQVYISFADAAGAKIDIDGDNYYPGNDVHLTGPAGNTFTVDDFIINESGSDVYGHYIDSRGGSFNPAPGIGNPFDPVTHAAGTGIDVVVGATIHTVAGGAGLSYAPGKYVGTYNVMVSY